MPNTRFNWHERIKEIEREYKAATFAAHRLNDEVTHGAALLNDDVRRGLRNAVKNLEGTYLVRLFAVFEAALRSYDRARHNDPNRENVASVLIDTIGGRRGMGIPGTLRDGAHKVRLLRNYWAHENDAFPEDAAMTIGDAQSRLQKYLARLPETWQ
jgi:hypothetical protein